MADDALFCVGQKAFIEKDGKILVIFNLVEDIDFPGGKIQEDEAKERNVGSLINSLKREVKEETDLNIDVFDPFAVWYHQFPKNHRNYPKGVYVVGFKCKYLSGDVKLSDEHNNFEWVDKSNYEKLNDGSDYFYALKKYFLTK